MKLRLKILLGLVCIEALLLPLAWPDGSGPWPADRLIGLHFALLAVLAWRLGGALSLSRQGVQQALAETERHNQGWQAVLDGAPDGVIGMDLQGTITLCNPAAQTLFGYRAEELLGRPFSLLVPAAAGGDWLRHPASADTLRGRHKDGSIFPVALSLSEWLSADGLGWIGWLRAGDADKSAAEEPAPVCHPADAASRTAPLAAQEITVLLAEDGPANQKVLSAMLRQGGFAVDVAGSGQEAIEAVSRRHYDVVLMDVSMPKMNGIEATRHLRGMGGPSAAVPIIAMTAHAVQGYREECLAAGMDDFATKPIAKQQLWALVAYWAGRRQPADSAALPAPDELLDMSTIRQVAADAGQEGDVAGLVHLFMGELARRRAAIAGAAEQADAAVLQHESHALKSEAKTFGALPLHRWAVEVEACCKRGDGAAAVAAAQNLLLCADATLAEMERRFGATP